LLLALKYQHRDGDELHFIRDAVEGGCTNSNVSCADDSFCSAFEYDYRVKIGFMGATDTLASQLLSSIN